MYMCACVCLHMFMYVFHCVCVRVRACMHACVHACVFVCVYAKTTAMKHYQCTGMFALLISACTSMCAVSVRSWSMGLGAI